MARPRSRAQPRRERSSFVHTPFFQLPAERRREIDDVLHAIRMEVAAWRVEHGIPEESKITLRQMPDSVLDKIHSILPWFIEKMIWNTGGDPRREGLLAPFWPREKSPPRPNWCPPARPR